MATEQKPLRENWLETLTRKKEAVAYALFGAAAALLALALILSLKFGWETWPEAGGCGFLACVFFIGGVWYRTRESDNLTDLDATRILVLAMGGFLGFTIAVATMARAIRWWDFMVGGMEVWQSKEGWHVWVCAIAELVGLAIMFASLLLARTEERSTPILRRLLYGSNAVLTGLLLLAILLVVNVLVYMYVPAVSDWTATGQYTLSSQSKALLTSLDKPLTIYVLREGAERLWYLEIRKLLENCRLVNDKIQVKYLSSDQDPERIEELIQRYQFPFSSGLLVVYGYEGQEEHQFVKKDDMISMTGGRARFRDDDPSFEFKGEDALMTAIDYLTQGKSRPIIYFTQGHGELDINDSAATRMNQGAGSLVERLKKSNYDVKGLKFTPATGKAEEANVVTGPKVPDGAAIVVVAGPHVAWPSEDLAALRDYMNPSDPKKPKGKLVMLLDVVVNREGTMVQTGLEKFLLDYGVEVGNNRVMSLSERPLWIMVTPDPGLAERNPVAAAFRDHVFLLFDVRTVKPKPVNPNQPGTSYQPEGLLYSISPKVWVQDDLKIDVTRLVNEMIRMPAVELQSKLSRRPVPVAVAVSETGKPEDPTDPHAFMRQNQNLTPRLLVFGDASFASNASMVEEAGTTYYDLFASALGWLRERPGNIGIQPKKHDIYAMQESTNVSRMVLLPFGLMVFGVVGLGLGVWVIRRR